MAQIIFLLSTKSQWHFFIQESILHSSCSWTETYAEAFVAMPLSSVGNKNCGMAQKHRNGKFAFLSLKPLQNQSCSINFCSFLWQRQWLRTFRTTLSLSCNLSRRIDSSFGHDFSEKHFQWNRNDTSSSMAFSMKSQWHFLLHGIETQLKLTVQETGLSWWWHLAKFDSVGLKGGNWPN